MDDSLPVPRSSSHEERRLEGTRSQRRSIWRVVDVSGRGEAAESGGASECEVGGLFGILADSDPEVVVVGRWAEPENNFELELELGGGVHDMKKTGMQAGIEDVSVKCPQSLSGCLERWCFG